MYFVSRRLYANIFLSKVDREMAMKSKYHPLFQLPIKNGSNLSIALFTSINHREIEDSFPFTCNLRFYSHI